MQDRVSNIINNIVNNIGFAVVIASLLAIAYFIATGNMIIGVAIAFLPIVVLIGMVILSNPFWGFVTLFLINYFLIAIIRYTEMSGLSIMIDILIALTLTSFFLQKIFIDRNQSSRIINPLTVLAFIWLVYCTMELANPRGMTSVWFQSRGLSYYLLAMSAATFTTFKDFKLVKSILMLLSVLTLIGVAKAIMQKYVGFDFAETRDLNRILAKTHLLLTGTRYFSIYSSAGIFGAVTGHALVVFGILSISEPSKKLKIYYIIVALASFYGMMISGTRGSIAIPAAGFTLFVILSKKIKIIIPSTIILGCTYIFLAMTTIGQGNSEIRRMRTALDPNEPSLMVRLSNQKLLGEYLEDKPFGEGLGLSGVDAQNVSERFTTSIPTDSWYVKIWVETGVVGLSLHIGILLFIVIYGSYSVLFKIKDNEIKQTLMALLCGVFGILISSYGNQVLGQYPVVLIIYMSMAFIFMGSYFDNKKSGGHQTKL